MTSRYIVLVSILIIGCSTTTSPYKKYANFKELVIIDRKPDPERTALKKLKSNQIEKSEIVPPNEFSTTKFGEEARNGLLFIYTKSYYDSRAQELSPTNLQSSSPKLAIQV